MLLRFTSQPFRPASQPAVRTGSSPEECLPKLDMAAGIRMCICQAREDSLNINPLWENIPPKVEANIGELSCGGRM